MRASRLSRKTHLKKHDRQPDCVTVYDLSADREEGQAPLLLADFALAQDWAADAPATDFQDDADIVAWMAQLASQSPTAAKLWSLAASHGWSVDFTDLKGGGFYLELDQRRILLDHFSMQPHALARSAYFRNACLLTMMRALREIWHEHKIGAVDRQFAPENILMVERIRAADGDVVTMLCAWEMRGAGFADIWRHFIGTEEGDMALVFTRFLERDPTSSFDGSALSYAFRQWFMDEARVNGADHQTLEMLDGLLANPNRKSGFGTTRLEGAFIEAMSELPGGMCYLRGLGDMIRKDPFFAGLNDPINQSHLFHLIYDTQVVMVNNVPFRDARLARMIFPDGPAVTMPS